MTEHSRLGRAALRYAAAGLLVSPVQRNKIPFAGTHGHLDGTSDAGRIAAWWTRWPDANIRLCTGSVARWFVLDFDPRNGSDDGRRALERRCGPLPETRSAISGGGGVHLYFGCGTTEIRTSSGVLAKGIDVLGDRAAVTAAPSIHLNGNEYTWSTPILPIASAPTWLLDLVRFRPVPARPPVPVAVAAPPGYARAALLRELDRVASAEHGQRNGTLFRAACSLGELVAAGLLAEEPVESLLVGAGTSTGLSESESRAAARSGLRRGKAHPRRIERGGRTGAA